MTIKSPDVCSHLLDVIMFNDVFGEYNKTSDDKLGVKCQKQQTQSITNVLRVEGIVFFFYQVLRKGERIYREIWASGQEGGLVSFFLKERIPLGIIIIYILKAFKVIFIIVIEYASEIDFFFLSNCLHFISK